MSTLYPDLSLTNFPGEVDSFPTWLDVGANDGPLIKQYHAALQNGNATLANQILSQIPAAPQKLLKATDLNKLSQSTLAVERFYGTDVEPYIQEQQTNWQNTIDQFSFEGTWSSNTSYLKNNIVSYASGGSTLLYIAISDPPVGTIPTNGTYWRVFTIQGQPGAAGTGLSYMGEWSSSVAYTANTAVTYDGALWMSLQPSTNKEPSTNPSDWQLIMNLETSTYPIQDTPPTNQKQGDLWFNTQVPPTQYYYLEPLVNPAIASSISYGLEAYDEQGNLLVGTMAVPVSIAVTTNPTKMNYTVGEYFDPTGMVVTATFSDGSEQQVPFLYSPTGALTASDTTISISYISSGATVGTTLTITVASFSTTLNDNTWEQISQASSQSIGANYWAVGDTKEIVLNGTVGDVSLNNYSTWVYIIGFNHNSTLEGTGVTFGTFKTMQTSGVDVALIDSHYGNDVVSGVKTFNINHWKNTSPSLSYNDGGWKGCDMRYDILGSTNVEPSGYGSVPTSGRTGYDATSTCATNPVSNTLMSALPSDLRAVMKPMTIYTDNRGGGSSVASNVTATIDYLPLLAEFEIMGTIVRANPAEQNYQTQYEYYASGNSKVKYRYNSTINTAQWWERSLKKDTRTDFLLMVGDGTSSYSSTGYSNGIAPIFRV